jgi:hypothetical protein
MRRSTIPSFFLFTLLSTACASTNMHSTTDSQIQPASPAPASHQPLDGKVFDIVLVQANGQPKGPDQLVFDSALFESTACRPYGFTATKYTTDAQGDDVRFEAVAKSRDAGTNSWKGAVHGGTVRGTMTWSNPKGETESMTFEGKAASGVLDGRTFDVEIVGADGKAQDKDHLTFAGGSFDSSSCRPFGFIRTGYTTKVEGDATRFEAVCASAEYGMNHWEGTIRGDRIEGTLKAGDPAGPAPTLRFSGKRVP